MSGPAIASRHGVSKPLSAICTMRRRWESCSASGQLTLNVNLAQTPGHCIEYIIMHELCHIKHHNHSKAFYSLLTRCQSDWLRRKETLDKFRLTWWSLRFGFLFLREWHIKILPPASMADRRPFRIRSFYRKSRASLVISLISYDFLFNKIPRRKRTGHWASE